LPDEFVPTQGMMFDEFDSVYEFYCDYAKMAGFDVRKSKKSPHVAWYVCNKEGFCDSGRVDKKTENGSMRVGCKGHMKVKLDVKGQYWYCDNLELKHNHPLQPYSCMVRYMQSHKRMEDGVKNLMNVMTRARVEHQEQMHVMSKLHGGRENWTFTERDMKNRYVLNGKRIVVVVMVTIARMCLISSWPTVLCKYYLC
jgi:hypothetical protein